MLLTCTHIWFLFLFLFFSIFLQTLLTLFVLLGSKEVIKGLESPDIRFTPSVDPFSCLIVAIIFLFLENSGCLICSEFANLHDTKAYCVLVSGSYAYYKISKKKENTPNSSGPSWLSPGDWEETKDV